MNDTAAQRHKLWNKNFTLLCVQNLLLFVGFHMQFTTFALFIKYLGEGEAMAGLAAGIFSVSSVLIRPIIGWVLDNRGRRAVMLVGVAGMLVLPLGYSLFPLIALILAMRLLHGMSWACCTTSVNTVVSDILPREHFGQGMGWFGITSAVSASLAPSIGLFLIEGYGFKTMFLVAAALALWALFIAFQVHISPVRQKNGLKFRHSVKSLLNKEAVPASLTMLLFLLPYGASLTFVALYASTTDYLPTGGVFFLIMAGMSAMARILFGSVVDRRGEKIIVYGSTAGMLAAYLLLAFWPTSAAFFLSAALVGLSFGCMAPSMQAMAMRIAPLDRRGSASSTYLLAFDIGTGLGGVVAGVLVEALGYQSMFTLMSLAAVLSFLVYFFWGRKHPSSFAQATGKAQ